MHKTLSFKKKSMKLKIIAVVIFYLGILFTTNVNARECYLAPEWQNLCPILHARVAQSARKMKLPEQDAKDLEFFLQHTKDNFADLHRLQHLLPKTTVELLLACCKRGVTINEANLMAKYLAELLATYKLQNIGAFDENTSHIIGREWHEIDYSGEGMTWKKQQAKYSHFGITNFKTLENLEKFFPVEAKLPYFSKIYKPAKCN